MSKPIRIIAGDACTFLAQRGKNEFACIEGAQLKGGRVEIHVKPRWQTYETAALAFVSMQIDDMRDAVQMGDPDSAHVYDAPIIMY